LSSNAFGTLLFIAAEPPSCRQVGTLPKTLNGPELEAKLIEAHAELELTQQSAEIAAVVTLARFGAFEVRLIVPSDVAPTGEARFWMDLYDHDRRLSIDSVGDRVLKDAVVAAEDLIERATTLSENPHSWRRST
jgi:hypothetical protein